MKSMCHYYLGKLDLTPIWINDRGAQIHIRSCTGYHLDSIWWVVAMKNPIWQLFQHPFRIFFLSAALWAVVVVPFWALWISGSVKFDSALNLIVWHRHEMLFGFVNAGIAGFLMTAVCVWTQSERMHGFPLFLLWLVWLAGRILSLVDFNLPFSVIVSVNLAFLPVVLFDAGIRVLKARQQRQYILLLLLALLWIAEAGVLIDPNHSWSEISILVIFTLMSVVGGRITPGFSAGWLNLHGGDSKAVFTDVRLDWLAILLLLILCCSLFTANNEAIAFLAVLACLAQLFRILLWRGWLVRGEPLLWILHISMLWIPISLLLLAAGRWQLINALVWIHAAGIGAITSLILGVMARVCLGHTARALTLPKFIALSFLLIQLCAVLRAATASGVIPWQTGVMLSTILWVVCFGLFIWRYLGIVMTPRIDGRSG